MGALDDFYVHTATVRTYLADEAYGPTYADGVEIACYIDAQNVLTINAAGQQITQRNTVLYADSAHAALLTIKSKVSSAQLGDDDEALVVKVNVLDVGPLMSDMAHVEVTLQ